MSRRVGLLGVLAAALALGAGGQVVGAGVVFYLSDVSLESGLVPTPTNPQVTLKLNESVTLYLWAQFASGTSTFMSMNYVETSSQVVTASTVTVWNGILNPADDPHDPSYLEWEWAIYRWPGCNWTTGAVGGFACGGGFLDPYVINAAGLTSLKRTSGDPTWRGTSPYQWYVGSVTFTAAEVGQTDIFLTIGAGLLVGNSTLIGTPASPNVRFGAGEVNSSPVSVDGGTYYLAEGVTGQIADATITVVPEPAAAAMALLGALAGMRRLR